MGVPELTADRGLPGGFRAAVSGLMGVGPDMVLPAAPGPAGWDILSATYCALAPRTCLGADEEGDGGVGAGAVGWVPCAGCAPTGCTGRGACLGGLSVTSPAAWLLAGASVCTRMRCWLSDRCVTQMGDSVAGGHEECAACAWGCPRCTCNSPLQHTCLFEWPQLPIRAVSQFIVQVVKAWVNRPTQLRTAWLVLGHQPGCAWSAFV